jgi:DNA adenine methylase
MGESLKVLKTFTRRMGNKGKHLKHILPLFPDSYERYVEPFLGTGAVFLALRPCRFLINDLNSDVMDCWKIIRDTPPSLFLEKWYQWGNAFRNLPSTEEKLRVCRNIVHFLNDSQSKLSKLSKLDRTILYLLLTFCAYMGIVRMKDKYIIKGLEYNIYAKDRYSFLTSEFAENWRNVHTFLSKTPKHKHCIQQGDYKRILEQCKEGDIVFLDPPYMENHSYHFEYNKGEKERLGPSFLEELMDEMGKLDKKGVKWMMTQACTPEVAHHFRQKNYHITEFPVYRIGTRSYTTEYIIRNYNN